MKKGLTDPRHYAAIAEVLRKNGADAEGQVRPSQMAQKLQAMADHRYGEGHNVGYDAGMDAGYAEGYSVTESLLDRSITSFSSDAVDRLGGGVFHHCTALETVELPNATYLGSSAFENCDSLTSVTFPKVTQIGANAFYDCGNLKSVSLNRLTTAGTKGFGYCPALTAVNFPNLTNAASSLFINDTSLQLVFLPQIQTVGQGCFAGCSALSILPVPSLQKVTELGTDAFNSCTALKRIYLPQCTRLGTNAFANCTELEMVDIADPSISGAALINGYISSQAFNRCSKLTALVISATAAVLPLKSTYAFGDTPIADGTGYIYVPRNVLNAYKRATNWSAFANQIRDIESYAELLGG